jgi:hypothetical protein
MAKSRNRNLKPSRYLKYHALRYIVAVLVVIIVIVGLYLQQLNSRALTQNTYKSQFDYGQISSGSFSQPAGGIFSGTTRSAFNFNNTAPQHMVYRVGYLTTRVQVLNVTCLTEWGCHRSTAGERFGRNKPHIAVCIDVPNGYFPETTQLFSVQFKALTALNESNNWWTTDSIIAPDSCQVNPNSEGFRINQIDGSGVCGGQFEPCDYGPNPGGEGYIGFGPRGGGQDQTGNDTGNSGTNQGNTGGAGGGGGGSTANTEADQPNTIPSSTSQGEQKQPEIEPSPFFDGKEYQPGSSAQVATGVIVGGKSIPVVWVYVMAAAVIGAIAAGVYYIYQRRKK